MNGIIFPSYADLVTRENGGWQAAYPFTNTRDLIRISKLARADGAGDRQVILNLPALLPIRAVALVGHNLPKGSTIQVSTTDAVDGGGNAVHATGSMPTWPGASAPVAGYRAVRPVLFGFTAPVRSIVIGMNTDAVIEIQGVDVGGFWEWPMGYGREIGVNIPNGEVDLAGGASYRPARNLKPRTVTGQVDLMKMEETATTGLDFQRGIDISHPFVWAEDWTDPTTWARKCMLVRNRELSPMVGSVYRRDRFPVTLIEHFR